MLRKEREVTGGWRELHNGSFIICILHEMLLEWSNQERWEGLDT